MAYVPPPHLSVRPTAYLLNSHLQNPTNSYSTESYIPSETEARSYLYGLPSTPRFIARSNLDTWKPPSAIDGHLLPKNLLPFGFHDRLTGHIWEQDVGPAMIKYLLGEQVQWTLLLPVRIGTAEETPSAVIMVGIDPGSLGHVEGIQHALFCRSLLRTRGIDDVHVIMYESRCQPHSSLYSTRSLDTDTVAAARASFSATLGMSVSTPTSIGSGGFFFTDPKKPGKLFLITARHNLFNPDEPNTLFVQSRTEQRCVLLFGTTVFDEHCQALRDVIDSKHSLLSIHQRRLTARTGVNKQQIQQQIQELARTIAGLETLHEEILRDWGTEHQRTIGHLVLSPPIEYNSGPRGYTSDWAVVEIIPSVISRINFVGNHVNLAGPASIEEIQTWMQVRKANPHLFVYPTDDLLRCTGSISEREMLSPDGSIMDKTDTAVIPVIKRGHTSIITVGHLNTIRSFARRGAAGAGQPSGISKEICVLARSRSEAFSHRGDSGAAVLDGKGRMCGILTGGAAGGSESGEACDCTFVTPTDFLVERLAHYGFNANILPTAADLPAFPESPPFASMGISYGIISLVVAAIACIGMYMTIASQAM